MKKHKEFTISAKPFHTDLISGQLWNLPIEGISEETNFLILYAAENSSVNKSLIEKELKKLINENLLESLSIKEQLIEEINWNEEWERNLKPIQAADGIVIKQTFNEVKTKPGDLVITIDPKMSFGTGEHETTKLMLRQLKRYKLQNKTILDLGSGTAVLSIAAAKMGAGKVVAIDNDEWCLENGIENVNTNHVANIVDVRLAEIKDIPEKDFDIVFANINKNILLNVADEIISRTKQKGKIILSGLMAEDEEEVTNFYLKKGCRTIHIEKMNEWTALNFEKAK